MEIKKETKEIRVKIPRKLLPILTTKKRYVFLRGGRGGGKSHGLAECLLYKAHSGYERILCAREIQKSINESVHELLDNKIKTHGYEFEVLKNEIKSQITGSRFIFHGLREMVMGSVKSLEGITKVWVEEAQYISKYSLDILIPTIRAEGSQFFFSYNPKEDDDPITVFANSLPEEDKLEIEINYMDNPLCPEVLIKEAERSKAKAERSGHFGEYNHIWLGKPDIREGRIIKNYKVEDFSEVKKTFDTIKIRRGLDWGFSDDPLAYIETYEDRRNNRLYILRALRLYGHSNKLSYGIISPFAGNRLITADSAEPKSISEMKSYGLNMQGAKKGQGSVETGIKWLQKFDEIIIDPVDAIEFKEECEKYVWKTNRAGKVLAEPIDEHNHLMDAARYANESEMGGESFSGLF